VSGDRVDVAETFALMARALMAEDDPVVIMEKIVDVAISAIEACEHAGIELVEKRRIRPVAPSSEVAAELAELQNEVDEGPCLSAIWDHEVFYAPDLATETRWPRFAARASEQTHIASILGFRLYTQEDTMGALNLYSSQVDAFDHDATAIGSVLAAHAAVAMSASRERGHLRDAIAGRDLIGQAKGILMARSGIDEDAAFEVLKRASQRLNLKLGMVADQVVHPPDPPDPSAAV
jgi:transcriptional regulator with GAF, ATPase, and Fis domain